MRRTTRFCAASRRIAPHIRLFSDYLDDEWPSDVPDPYYGEEEGFEVLDMMEAGCLILNQLGKISLKANLMKKRTFAKRARFFTQC